MKEIIEKTRTYRRFDSTGKISTQVLMDLVELARLSGSARNCQPWQYLLVNEEELCAKIFPHLGWAGYLADWKGPAENERPTAYILCYLNKDWLKGSVREAYFDLGISTQNLLLGATALGLGGCRIASFSTKLAKLFSFSEHQELFLVIALGQPAEEVTIEECQSDEIKYWRDPSGTHHVPKRKLDDIVLSVPE